MLFLGGWRGKGEGPGHSLALVKQGYVGLAAAFEEVNIDPHSLSRKQIILFSIFVPISFMTPIAKFPSDTVFSFLFSFPPV